MLEKIFKELQELNLCRSPSEFSREWLGRDQSYYRSLRWHNRSPSIQAISNCSAKLEEMADCFMQSQRTEVVQKGHRLKSLSHICQELLTDMARHEAL